MGLPACCTDFDISLVDLIFPERLDASGWEFVQAHGITAMNLGEIQSRSVDLGDGRVKIKHICAQLSPEGKCMIYATRPQICRDYDCSKRTDCACQGHGFIQVADILPIDDDD